MLDAKLFLIGALYQSFNYRIASFVHWLLTKFFGNGKNAYEVTESKNMFFDFISLNR